MILRNFFFLCTDEVWIKFALLQVDYRFITRVQKNGKNAVMGNLDTTKLQMSGYFHFHSVGVWGVAQITSETVHMIIMFTVWCTEGHIHKKKHMAVNVLLLSWTC